MYELLEENKAMADIGAMVSHPALWKKLRKTGIASDQTPLTMPQEGGRVAEAVDERGSVHRRHNRQRVIADWRDLLFGVRKQITVRVLSTAPTGRGCAAVP